MQASATCMENGVEAHSRFYQVVKTDEIAIIGIKIKDEIAIIGIKIKGLIPLPMSKDRKLPTRIAAAPLKK